MRSLALARYRFLVSIRSTGVGLGGLLAAVAGTVLGSIGALSTADISWSAFPRQAPEAFRLAAAWVTPAYLFHSLALMALCFAFGTAQRRSEQRSADLMQTAPVSAAQTFWGDCLGVLAAVLSVHAAVVPLLAVIVALSPHSSATFWIFELAVLIVLFLASALAAWSLRAESWRWSIARSFRASVTLLLIVAGAAGLFARRPAGLAEALIALLENPGRSSLTALVSAFRNPPTATLVFVILYAAFVAFFFIHSVRRALRE